MSLVDSLMVSLLGLIVVFLMLCLLCILIKVLSVIVRFILPQMDTLEASTIKRTSIENVPTYRITSGRAEVLDDGCSAGELHLLGVDEKTAAMVMAIVSDECQIPLSELQFKTIKAID